MIPTTRKPAETVGDYLAIGVCPALIMTMVGSLVLLLLEASYAGPWLGSMRWTLCWFTFAIVLVSRIAIEQNRALAITYGAVLGLATSAYLASHFGFILPVWILLGVVWWVADRLTWDCAMIDEEADSAGLGLLREARSRQSGTGRSGQGRGKREQTGQVRIVGAPGMTDSSVKQAEEDGKRAERKPSPGRASGKAGGMAGKGAKRSGKKHELHTPGKWVLYFALCAVPLFGVGEILIPSKEPGARVFAFWLLLVYLGSAAGLLLMTSFLGLRRYLRQRWTPMPRSIAVSWVNSGVWLIAGLMMAAVFLPRPVTSYSLDRLVTEAQKDGSGKGGQKAAPESKQVSEEASGGRNKAPDGKPQPAKGGSARPAPGKETLRLPAWGEWFSWLIALVTALWVFVRFRAEILRALQNALASLRSRRNRPNAARRSELTRAPASAPAAGLRFSNPFQNGLAATMTEEELLCHTFEAAKAWAELRGTKPEDHETPVEFAERLSRREPALEREIRLLSRYYSHLAYAGRLPPPEAGALLQKLWSFMTFR